MESKADPSTIFGAYLMGLAFGFGWTACVGPVLASILMIASGMGDIWRGCGCLLFGLSALGMTAPFIVAAFFAQAIPHLGCSRHRTARLPGLKKAMGAMLIIFALS